MELAPPNAQPLLTKAAGSTTDPSQKPKQSLVPASERRRGAVVVAALVSVNVAVLTLLLGLGRAYPPLMSAGVLAMSFGLRHAVDADHIAAIDNVTRRLIQDGQRPQLVGLYFSLGHSSVVCIICIAAALGSSWLSEHIFGAFESGWGAVISTTVSAGLLLFIGIANLGVATKSAADARAQGHSHEHAVAGGAIAKCCPVLFSAVDAEWKMLLLGFLFGLGFETSSEVALLALAAMSPGQGIPPAATLVLPLLFAAGMSLIDTLDGLLMSWAYGFATSSARGRQLYNLYLTGASSLIAIAVGTIELLGCLQTELGWDGPFWRVVAAVNDNFEYVGYSIIAFFAVSTVAGLAALTCPIRVGGGASAQGSPPASAPPPTADLEGPSTGKPSSTSHSPSHTSPPRSEAADSSRSAPTNTV